MRIVVPNAFQEIFDEINNRMRKGFKGSKERDLAICDEASLILQNISESETYFLNSLLIRKGKVRNTCL